MAQTVVCNRYYVAGKPTVPGLAAVNVTLWALTLVLSTTTFSISRAKLLLGAVHRVVFLA